MLNENSCTNILFLLGSTDGQSSTSSPLSGSHTKDKSSSIDLEWEHEEGK